MAQIFTTKQQNLIQRLSNNIVGLMANIDAIAEASNEYTLNAFGSGGANVITDAAVQAILPAATAAQVSFAVGIFANGGGILSLIGAAGTSRVGLENLRP